MILYIHIILTSSQTYIPSVIPTYLKPVKAVNHILGPYESTSRYINLNADCSRWRGTKSILLSNLLRKFVEKNIPFVEKNPNPLRLDENQKYSILNRLKS